MVSSKKHPITAYLEQHYVILTIYGFFWAFVCYFSMYAFRKPYTVLKYKGEKLGEMEFKTLLITVQTIGYTISKFLGIKFVSELTADHRGKLNIILVGISEVALLFFAFVPSPYSAFFLFVNGLPLGMIWGIVYAFLEGRRTSEILGAGMGISFIVSSGAVKSIGKSLIISGLPEKWMPVTVGAIFFPILCFSTYMLVLLPGPNAQDIATRSEHKAMTGKDRIEFCQTFTPGVVLTVMFYTILTGFRDFRDNFSPELWTAILGSEEPPEIFTTSEIIVAVIVVIPIAFLMLLRSNMFGFALYFVIISVGLIISGVMTLAYDLKGISGTVWMISAGVGIYVGYIPFNSILYDRMIAAFRLNANSGFMMYVCDACGYLASIIVMFIKNFVKGVSWLDYVVICSYIMTIFGTVSMILSLIYFTWKYFQGYQIDAKINSVEVPTTVTLPDTPEKDSETQNPVTGDPTIEMSPQNDSISKNEDQTDRHAFENEISPPGTVQIAVDTPEG